jgi:hypothetical protein
MILTETGGTITAEDRHRFGELDKTVLLTPGYAGRHVARREIDDATPRRVLILGSVIWLAKQMNLIEFMTVADELFYERQIKLWVVGNLPDYLNTKNHFCATRFLGFSFRRGFGAGFSQRQNWYRRRADRRRVQAKTLIIFSIECLLPRYGVRRLRIFGQ